MALVTECDFVHNTRLSQHFSRFFTKCHGLFQFFIHLHCSYAKTKKKPPFPCGTLRGQRGWLGLKEIGRFQLAHVAYFTLKAFGHFVHLFQTTAHLLALDVVELVKGDVCDSRVKITRNAAHGALL
ncbi:Uncharacterised protein [Vibrio cholerae]|nr:Uncharacterised protein [Vibrio cholerae]